MAYRRVKCFYCGETFNPDKEPYVKPRSNRYAHKSCADRAASQKSQEETDKEILLGYINELFGKETNWALVNRQLEKYTTQENYSYSGIYKSLKYFYEVKRGDREKASGAIGIVPFIYDQAFRYYYAIWEAQQRNEITLMKMPIYNIPQKIIKIKTPERKQMGRKPLFTFLEEEN